VPDSATYDRRAVWSWALYDFANSAFNTLVVTFVYSTYFTSEIAASDEVGTTLWGNAAAVSAVLIAVLSPFLGTLADQSGRRKSFLGIATGATVLATAALFVPQSGDVYAALALFVAANTAFELAFVFYNAYLPDLAPADMMGRISGWGWALGYAGGLLALGLGYALLVAPDEPVLFSTEAGANVRATNLLVAVWFALFSLPFFAFAPRQERTAETTTGNPLQSSFRELLETARQVRRFEEVVRLLAARLFYNDGLLTIFNFGSIYAANVLGFSFNEIFLFGITLNVAAGLGAFAFGFVDDRLGGRRTLLITVAGLTVGTMLALAAQTKAMLWIAGVVIGVFIGPNQSASRSLLGRFTPPDKKGEFFGFFAFSGKATAFLGPLLFGWATLWFETQRAGVASVLIFFVIGGLLLLTVDEEAGKRRSRAAAPNDPSGSTRARDSTAEHPEGTKN
jgi:UMF1 family MFS transporter